MHGAGLEFMHGANFKISSRILKFYAARAMAIYKILRRTDRADLAD